ncbi:MAG: DUF2470 domain-containing protein [Gammaproteobacteria bacterium]|nr:DUF2470 domain-containing protein [Gammaproteobacteria bacterium]
MFDEQTEQDMVAHMNEDHVDAMRDYCRLNGIKTFKTDPKMLSIDRAGVVILVNDENLRIDFSQECETPQQVRAALVELAKEARQ